MLLPRPRDPVILALIAAGHVAVFWLVNKEMRAVIQPDRDTQRTTVVFMSLPALPKLLQIQAEPNRKAPTKPLPISIASNAFAPGATQKQTTQTTLANTEPAEIAAGSQTSSAAAIDWHNESEQAARRAAQEMAAPSKIKSLDSGNRATTRRGTAEKTYSFEWRAEEKRVGFTGGLPYVRLGKRCIVGLGFFGCAIGKLPEANGELFKHMHDDESLLTNGLSNESGSSDTPTSAAEPAQP